MMVQWSRSLDAKLEAYGSNPSLGIEKEKSVITPIFGGVMAH